jgi:hypothetical protein
MLAPFGRIKKIAHLGVKTSVGRGKPEIIPENHKKPNTFKRLSFHERKINSISLPNTLAFA